MNRAQSPETPASYAEAWRSYFDNGLQLVNAMLAGAGRLRDFQLGAARELQAKHLEIAGQLAGAKSMQEVLALQRALVQEYSEGAIGYWTRLTELMQSTQAELAAALEKQGTRVLEQASVSAQAPAQVYGAPGELIAIMQTAFDAARDANQAFVKALAHAPMAAKKKAAKPAQPQA